MLASDILPPVARVPEYQPPANAAAVAALLSALYDAHARRDLVDVFSFCSPDVVIRQTSQLPWGGTYRGLDEARWFYASLVQHVESRFEVQEIVVAGERAVVMGRTRGLARHTGEAFDLRAVHVYELRGGKVARMEAYVDTPAMLAVL